MKKDVLFEWDDACQHSFDSIKKYFLNPQVLAAPIQGKLLILHITAQEYSLGAMLAQVNHEGKENALCHLSRMMVGGKINYSPIEKICLALIFTIKKLRHYMMARIIHLISRAYPLKYIMSGPVFSGQLRNGHYSCQNLTLCSFHKKQSKGKL